MDKRTEGPGEEELRAGRSYLAGTVRDDAGNEKTTFLQTPQAYDFTAKSIVAMAKNIENGNFKKGYQTPATAFGEQFILEIEGCSMQDVK